MRQAIIPLILATLTGCMTTGSDQSYAKANTVMAAEISRRIQEIQFQHRTELLDNLMWLAQAGEQAIPSLLPALKHDEPKVRANAAWVLGRIKDRRAIGDLQSAAGDSNPTVRIEVARSLVTLGDVKYAPALIEGLDSERPAVRYNCHQALKEATGRDFGYDHLAENVTERQRAVLRWRQWWGEQFQDQWFASSYAQTHGFAQGSAPVPAMPMTEMAPPREPAAPAPGSPEQGKTDQGKTEQGKTEQGKTDQGIEIESTSTSPQNQPKPQIQSNSASTSGRGDGR